MNREPYVCTSCGHVETEFEFELDKDCQCGGHFAPAPYQFTVKDAAKSSTSILTNAPGKIACQTCGCRDRMRMHCECSCHEVTNE